MTRRVWNPSQIACNHDEVMYAIKTEYTPTGNYMHLSVMPYTLCVIPYQVLRSWIEKRPFINGLYSWCTIRDSNPGPTD